MYQHLSFSAWVSVTPCHLPDEVCVEPEEEGAVIVAPGHAGRGAVEHELGVPVHPGPGHQLNTHLAHKVIKMIS